MTLQLVLEEHQMYLSDRYRIETCAIKLYHLTNVMEPVYLPNEYPNISSVSMIN